MATGPGELRGTPVDGDAPAHLPRGPEGRTWRLLDRLVIAGFALALIVPGALLAAGVRPNRV